VAQFGPVEIDTGNFRLRFLRAHQSGKREWQIIEIMPACIPGIKARFMCFFRAFDRFPLFKHCNAVACIAIAEDMWMTPDQFLRYILEHTVDVEPAEFARRDIKSARANGACRTLKFLRMISC